MRPRILLLFIFFYTFYVSAQELPLKNDKVVYEIIVENDSISKQDMYSAGKKYIANTFKNSKYVTQSDDPIGGAIICKGKSEIYRLGKNLLFFQTIEGGVFDFTMQLDSKDGRSRLMIYDISIENINGKEVSLEHSIIAELRAIRLSKGKTREKRLQNYYKNVEMVNDRFNGLLIEFKKAINNHINDNW